jgi:hypothetical protein
MRTYKVVVLGGTHSGFSSLFHRSNDLAHSWWCGEICANRFVWWCMSHCRALMLEQVRFVRDVFVENYDPTIEGAYLRACS